MIVPALSFFSLCSDFIYPYEFFEKFFSVERNERIQIRKPAYGFIQYEIKKAYYYSRDKAPDIE